MTLNFAPKRSSDRTPPHSYIYIYNLYIYIYPPLLITDLLICQLSLFFPCVSLHLFVCSFICSSIVLLLLSYPIISVPFVLSLPSLSDVDGPVLFRKGMSWQSFSGDCLDPKVQKLAKQNLVKAFIDVFGQDFGLMADDISIACGKSRRNEKSVLPETGN